MKVYYITNFFGNEVSGVQKKIISQVYNLNNLGIPSEIYSITGTNDDSQKTPFVKKVIVPDLDVNSPKSFPQKIKRVVIRTRALSKIIETENEDVILYTRAPSSSWMMSEIMSKPRKCKIVVEYQSKGPNESLINGEYLDLINDFFYGTDIRKNSDGIVGVTNEITKYELKRSGDPDKPHITIGNGFDTRSVPLRTPQSPKGPELHLLCVANVNKWHGLDRLLKGMAAGNSNPSVIFHIAGEGTELPYLKRMVKHLGLESRVIFHGFLTGNELDNLFDSCHIAVGSLGMHRIGLHEASILKAREYCARGIPFIVGCADPDFPDDFPCILTFPANESAVDIEKIVEFAQKISRVPDSHLKMRAYAIDHLDWSVKMKVLKSFLERVAGTSA